MARRILLLITDLEIGGTPTVVRELAIRLSAGSEAHFEVACLSAWGPVAGQLREQGVKVTALNARGACDLRVVDRLVQLIHRSQIDTVFSFLIHANTVATLAGLFCRDVCLLQSIQTTQVHPRWHWIIQGLIQHAANKIVVPSESVARVAHEWSNIPADKIEIIPNAIDLADFPNAAIVQPLMRHDQVTPNASLKVRIGFIGRLDPVKRIPDLVQAMTLLEDRFELHIYGEGSDRAMIERKVNLLDMQSRVTLHGRVAHPQTALGQIDVLVLPSEAEGFGLVLIEAMASGVPVVATNVAGICDVLRNEETGLLVPPKSPMALAGAIRRIKDDQPLCNRLITAGRDDVAARFTWDRVLFRYMYILGIDPCVGAGRGHNPAG